MRRTLAAARFYVTVGVLNLAVGVMFYVVNLPALLPPPAAAALVPIPTPPPPIPIKQGTPTHISLPSLGIDLPVGVGVYDPATGGWTVDDSQAYYADTSLPANDQAGVTLIYGHAQRPVFINLPAIQPGAVAIVSTDTGYTFHYRYQSMRQVVPTDTSVFQASGPPTLVLQTCLGAWSNYRGMYTFSLTSVEGPS